MYLYIVNYLFVLIGFISRPSSAPTTAHSDMENEVGNNFFQIFFWKYFFQIVFSPERFSLVCFSSVWNLCNPVWLIPRAWGVTFVRPTNRKIMLLPGTFPEQKIHEENYVLPKTYIQRPKIMFCQEVLFLFKWQWFCSSFLLIKVHHWPPLFGNSSFIIYKRGYGISGKVRIVWNQYFQRCFPPKKQWLP